MAETRERSGKLSEAGQRGAAKRWGNDDGQANGQAIDQDDGQANGNRIEENKIENSLSQTGEKKTPNVNPSSNPDAHRLAEYLREWILKNNPSARPSTDDWAVIAAKMIEEGRDADDIAFVIEWCQRDDFWKSRTLSMGNIQKHYDQLVLKSGLIDQREAAAREKRRQEMEEERRIEDEVDRAWYEANREEIDAAADAAFQKFREEGRKLFKKVPE